MKIPKRISQVISSIQSPKKLPVFIYNTPEELKEAIISAVKKPVVIDSNDVRTQYHITNEIAKQLGIATRSTKVSDPSLFVRIEHAIENRVIILLRPELLALSAYDQISKFVKVGIPVIAISTYVSFFERFRHTKYYEENVIIEIDCKEL